MNRHPLTLLRWRVSFFLLLASAIQAALACHGAELLVFYANETSPCGAEATNYLQFEQWLAAMPTEKSKRVLHQLQRDKTEFRAVVERESAALATAPVHVLMFQNALARKGAFLECRPALGAQLTEVAFPELPAFDDLVYRANPLSGSEGFDAALRAVRRVAEREGITRAGFIIKSHGSPALAVTPRLGLWHTEVCPEEVAALLEHSEPNPAKPLRGMTRRDLAERLNAFQTAWGRTVEFVYAECCRANANGPSLRLSLQPNIRRLFVGRDDKVDYQTLDYPALLRTSEAQAGSFLTAFADELAQHPKLVEFKWLGWRERLLANWSYFVPITLVILGGAARAVKRNRLLQPAISG